MHLNPAIDALLGGLSSHALPVVDLSLARIRVLLSALDNPHLRLPPVVHIAGTNGKGSTLAFLRAIYEASGYRVHSYTSPHLVRFNERIVLAGSTISDTYLLQLLTQVDEAARSIPVTFFEATTAAAFIAFSQHAADVLLLETGLGGRLDATNVVPSPLATVITPIDYDHREFLGNSLGEIAVEKAGIIKPDTPCFVGRQSPEALEILKRTASAGQATLWLHGREWSYLDDADGLTVECGVSRWHLPPPSLSGEHQYHNAALASVVAASLVALPVTQETISRGIVTAYWPARLQRLVRGTLVEARGGHGSVFLDGGHNIGAACVLRDWVIEQEQPVTLVLGMMKRKDAGAFLAPLAGVVAGVISVPITQYAAYQPWELAAAASALGMAQVSSVASLGELAEMVRVAAPGTILIAGSLFLAGEILKNHS